jgi:flagellar hook-basal body complex protein FliE
MEISKFSRGAQLGGEFGVRESSTSVTSTKPSAVSPGASFSDTLSKAIEGVDQLHKQADVAAEKIATGQSQNLHETMIAAEKADIALRLMVQVRNKIIDAYHEVMKMQV